MKLEIEKIIDKNIGLWRKYYREERDKLSPLPDSDSDCTASFNALQRLRKTINLRKK